MSLNKKRFEISSRYCVLSNFMPLLSLCTIMVSRSDDDILHCHETLAI